MSDFEKEKDFSSMTEAEQELTAAPAEAELDAVSADSEMKAERNVIDQVKWSASELDFVETAVPLEEASEGEAQNPLEMLTKSIAETVSKKKKRGRSKEKGAAQNAAAEPEETAENLEAAQGTEESGALEAIEAVEPEQMALASESLLGIDEEQDSSVNVAAAMDEESGDSWSDESAAAELAGQETFDLEEAPAEESGEAAVAENFLDGELAASGLSEEELAAEFGPEQVEFIDQDQLISIIESVLFSTDRPVSIATLKPIFKGTNIRNKDLNRAIETLRSEYAGQTRGVTLEEINGGFQLRTKVDNAEYLRRLAKIRPFRLSGPSLEVMSIVAYKQPITKHEIDEIRGVESGHILRALMERGLTAFGEKSDLPGKPMTYVSTRKFLEIFGLRNIRELPSLREIDELLPEGIGEVEEEKETLSQLTDRMSTELTSTYSEGEEELAKINEQLQAVDTTSEFFEQEKQRERDRRDRDRAKEIRERLVLGDHVDEKDRRWLDRYEAKLNAPPEEAAKMQTEALEAEAEDRPQISSELESLTEESVARGAHASSEEAHEENHEETSGEDELFDELAVNADWDDDDAAEI